MRLRRPLDVRLSEATAERVRRERDEALNELQRTPAASGRIIEGVELPDAVDVRVPHGLGRPARVFISPPRGGASNTGRITDRTEILGEDRTKYVVLRASGWSITLVVDIWAL